MRKLMWFALGFGGACILSTYLLWQHTAAGIWIALIAAGGLGTLAFRRARFRIPACITLGCLAGFCWFALVQHIYLFPVNQLDGQTEHCVITAANFSEKSLYGTSVEGNVTVDGKPYKILAYLKGEQAVQPGDRMEGEFRIRLTTPGGLKESTYFQGKGTVLIASQTGKFAIRRPEHPALRYLPARLAQTVKDLLESCFPEDVLPFAKALLLGDSTDLDYVTNTAFKISGIRHIIAVSGLHVAILYGLIMVITAKRRYPTALIGLPVMFLFAAMAGFTPSVSRAAIMVSLMMLARVLGRDYDTLTELAFACLLLMLVNPMTVASVSFQLSVASVVGILLFQPGIQKKLETFPGNQEREKRSNRIRKWAAGTVSITLSAAILSTPLSAYYFGAVSLISPLTNLLTIWIVGLIFYGILLTCGLGTFLPAWGRVLGRVFAWPMRFVLRTAKLLSGIPLAAVYTKSQWIVGWIVFSYLLIISYLVFRKGRIRYCLSAAAAALSIAMVLSWYLPRQDDCRMTVLDVGQGQSILLQSKGRSFLVDCGGYSDTGTADTVAETLLSQSIFKLDGILLTHYDRDHTGGLPYLLTRVDTNCLYLPFPDEKDFARDIRTLTEGEIHWAENGEKITLGNAVITVLNCKDGKSDNENSLGILFETQDCAILVTGDRNKAGERALLKGIELPDVDVLIAGHHGSKNSTTDELLEAVKPEEVYISVGAGNSYGHPAQETLKRLEDHGCRVYRTDEMGTIVFRR